MPQPATREHALDAPPGTVDLSPAQSWWDLPLSLAGSLRPSDSTRLVSKSAKVGEKFAGRCQWLSVLDYVHSLERVRPEAGSGGPPLLVLPLFPPPWSLSAELVHRAGKPVARLPTGEALVSEIPLLRRVWELWCDGQEEGDEGFIFVA